MSEPLPVRLLSVASAVPPHVIGQDEALEASRRLFGKRFAAFARLSGVFGNSGIESRRSATPIDWFFEPKGWPERTAAYLAASEDLFIEAAARALERAGVAASEVDAIVTVSSTGIATPSLEARVFSRLGFRRDVQRVPVFGLGCAGGVSGLAIAGRLAARKPGATVLFVTIELCTLAFRLDKLTKANIVATALFGDGAAACVVRSGGQQGRVIEGAGERIWPDTLDIMGWDVDEQGLGVIFAQAIPPFVEANMAGAVDEILADQGLSRGEVGRFVCHPGGAKVLAALESALALDDGALDLEREVLAEFGNMSAPTVLFVLEKALERREPGRLFLTALGPGFTASGLVLGPA